jgi:DNA-directed RNA polymerase specialized sigma24 family protein
MIARPPHAGAGEGHLAVQAEDIQQDVSYELVKANRLPMPIEHVTEWLFRVARNRISDLFRKKGPESFSDTAVAGASAFLHAFAPWARPAPQAGSIRHAAAQT